MKNTILVFDIIELSEILKSHFLVGWLVPYLPSFNSPLNGSVREGVEKKACKQHKVVLPI